MNLVDRQGQHPLSARMIPPEIQEDKQILRETFAKQGT